MGVPTPAFGWPHPRTLAVGCTRHCWAAHACVWLPASLLGCGCLRLAVHIVVGLCTPAIGCPRCRWTAYARVGLPASSWGFPRFGELASVCQGWREVVNGQWLCVR